MNRHQRRAIQAQARRCGPEYLNRILAAAQSGALPATGFLQAAIEHDDRCGLFQGQGCSCCPNISVVTPSGVVVIDEHGVGRKVARQ
jgi:hypothetical protein